MKETTLLCAFDWTSHTGAVCSRYWYRTDIAKKNTVSAWEAWDWQLSLEPIAHSHHRNIRPRMRAPILFQVNKWRLINYSKWPIYKGKLNSPHDILYTTLLGKIQDGGFIRAFLFSFWTPVTWQGTHSRSNISMIRMQQVYVIILVKTLKTRRPHIKVSLYLLLILQVKKLMLLTFEREDGYVKKC